MAHVVVIGGGIAGLTAAFRLSEDGYAVTLVESSDQLGGLGTFFRSGDQWMERFYHCTMPSDTHLHELMRDAGMDDCIDWKPTQMGLVHRGEHYAFNTPLDLLRFKPLSLPQRVRLGVMSLLLRHLGKGRDLDNVRTEDWLRGLFGDAIWERVWEPLFRSKFGPSVGDVPALYLWQRLGRERNVAVRGYPRAGYKGIIEALERAILSEGGAVRTGTPVSAIRESRGAGLQVTLGDGEVVDADWVISTAPLPLLRQLVAGSALEGQVCDPGLRYQGVVNALFFLSRPLEGYYWTPVLDSGTEFDGVVEMSALAGPAQFGGRHLAYTMKYTERTSALFAESDEVVAERWTDQLLSVYADLGLRREHITEVRVFRAPFVEPAYPLGYSKLKPPIQVGDSRLLLATTAQVYPNITAWNASVRLATEVVDHLQAQPAPAVVDAGEVAV